MLLLAAAAIATAHPGPHPGGWRPTSLTAQATATVRILSGARITATSRPAEAHVGTVQLLGADGQQRSANVLEFE